MKKISFILVFVSLILSNNANAKDGFYLGFDVNQSHAKHRIMVTALNPGDGNAVDYSENKTSNRAVNIGFNAGYNFNFNKIFLAPEIFYDHLNNSAIDPYGNPSGSSDRIASHNNDRLTLNYRYGAKLNLGYNVFEKFDLFVNAGLSYVSYNIDWNANLAGSESFWNRSRGSRKLAPLYGIGASYHINDDWATKVSYDHQSFNIQYITEGARSKVNLNVIKVGLIYKF